MKKYGFYCMLFGKDCFIETEQKNRTRKLAEDFLEAVCYALNKTSDIKCIVIKPLDIEYIQTVMRRASFEVKTIKNGNFAGLSYYEIEGENFNYGCDPCENPMEKCILIKR